MTGQIIEISTDNKHLSVEHAFLCVFEKEKELARIPFDNIEAVIANAHGITYSNNLLVRLAENKIPFVVCGSNHTPAAYLLPLDCHYRQGAVMDAQIEASEPQNKKLWQDIVKQKILMQASVLKFLNRNCAKLEQLSKTIKSGDTENNEAQAARYYWLELFGNEFRRNRDAEGINSLLNYGYTILRSAVIRNLCAAGLHPTLGIHHQNMLNSARLGDDLMEIFRPLVDMEVYMIWQEDNSCDVDAANKKKLVSILSKEIPTTKGFMELSVCIQNFCISLAKTYQKERKNLEFPLILKEMDWIGFNNG